MEMKKKYSILEMDYKVPEINDKTIKEILNHPQKFRGHVRTSTGRLYKTGEFEKKSDEILTKQLP